VREVLEHGFSLQLYTVSRDLKVEAMHDLQTLENRAFAADQPCLP
jgi:hypothetical protein